jgi:hypothetical protein
MSIESVNSSNMQQMMDQFNPMENGLNEFDKPGVQIPPGYNGEDIGLDPSGVSPQGDSFSLNQANFDKTMEGLLDTFQTEMKGMDIEDMKNGKFDEAMNNLMSGM